MEQKEEKKKTKEEVRERLRKDRSRRLAEKELAEQKFWCQDDEETQRATLYDYSRNLQLEIKASKVEKRDHASPNCCKKLQQLTNEAVKELSQGLGICLAIFVLVVNLILPGVGTAISACCLKIKVQEPQDVGKGVLSTILTRV